MSRYITSVEKRDEDDLLIYWCGSETEPHEFGVAFRGAVQNSYRDGMAESIVLALDVAEQRTEDWK